LGTWFQFQQNFCLKASEVDQELECEMHQTKYKVMIGCDMDLRPMTTTHIVRSCTRNGESRETYLYEIRHR
jgi:hypothetical protein